MQTDNWSKSFAGMSLTNAKCKRRCPEICIA